MAQKATTYALDLQQTYLDGWRGYFGPSSNLYCQSEGRMMVRKAFRYRLYPNQSQEGALTVQFGHARYVYNWGLAVRQDTYRQHGKGISYYTLSRMMTDLKRQSDYTWLREADSQVLQAKLEDLERAFTNFFEKRAQYPRFKSKRSAQSIRYPQRFKFAGNRIYLPKVGWVKAVFHRPLEGTPKNVTVSKTKSGEYYVSVQCEVDILPCSNTKPAIGVHLGLSHFATFSTGEKVDHPHYLRQSEKRLKRLQRRLSRKQHGSRNREKAKRLLARQHERVARQRSDFLHKLSHRLVTEHGLVKLENLNVSSMLKNHSLAKSIADSGWGMFGRFCEYKAPWYGSNVEQIRRFYPSSRMCHVCGTINARLELRQRFWTCQGCGTEHDRDYNASMVVLNAPTVGATGRESLGRSYKTSQLARWAQRSENQEAQGF